MDRCKRSGARPIAVQVRQKRCVQPGRHMAKFLIYSHYLHESGWSGNCVSECQPMGLGSIWNRAMPETLSFAGVLSTLVVCLSLLGLGAAIQDRKRQQMLRGIQLLQAGRIFLVHLQRHRGVNAARLSGVIDACAEVPELRRQVVFDMATMAGLDDWFANNENWQGITRHWASLSVNCGEMEPARSFDQHSRLIGGVIQLLSDLADHYGLDTNPRYSDVRVVWKEFLLIGEYIGQCRALGVQILTSPAADPERQRQMQTVESILAGINRLIERPACTRKLGVKQKQQLQVFVSYVRAQVFGNLTAISTMEFFNVATEAIDLVYEQFDAEMQRLHRLVAH